MGTYRKRFNEKARTGMLAKNEKLRKIRQKRFLQQPDGTEDQQDQHDLEEENEEDFDPNAEMLLPMTDAEKLERKRKMQEQLMPKQESSMSRKKRKRLEKYIEKQVDKEEKKVLFEKLKESKINTSVLKSMKTLGVGNETKKELITEALKQERQGIVNDKITDLLYREREIKDWEDDEEMRKFGTAPTPAFKDREEEEEGDDNESEASDDDLPKISGIIDQRPRSSEGFGFAGLKKIPKTTKLETKSYTWRTKLALQKARKHKVDLAEIDGVSSSEEEEEEEEEDQDENDSSEEDGSDSNDGESGKDESSDENEDDGEVWNGFSDDEVKTATTEDTEDAEKKSDDEDENEAENENEEDEKSGSEESEVDSEEEGDSDDEDSDIDIAIEKPSKGKEFLEWAKKQNEPEHERIETPIYKGEYKLVDRPEDKEALPAEMLIKSKDPNRKSYFVEVQRPEEIQEVRMKLPVVAEEQRIMEAIHNNDAVVICGETGSGKTTQVPQFLFEAGYGSPESNTPGMIGITQPRRVAAVSMAKRVGQELGNMGHKVAYQIRFDATVKEDTSVKFMTDGVLLRELSNDFTLSKYSALIIDEAHERNVNTDILIGVLTRVMKLRNSNPNQYKPLKLIIMSATLRVSDFAENKTLFETPPPILKVDARQFPVSVHFNRRTPYNYLDEIFRKTKKIHQRLPRGGILIFLTGQNEITTMVKRLRKAFPLKKKDNNQSEENTPKVIISSKETTTEAEDIDFGIDINNAEVDDFDENLEEEEEEEEGFEETLEEGQDENDPLYVLPLYSLLPTAEQMKVFQPPPSGARLCVIATNVAETSLTIPGIRYVVDAGRAKERVYDEATNVQKFVVDWISKASAQQRSGRAGRTEAGHCYRIYSSAVYENDFEQFSKPEILRMPIEGLVLQMKSMGIDKIVNFPFPTLPERSALKKGLKLLNYLGALDEKERLTSLGKSMSLFPLSPRFAKMLIIGNQFECLPYIVAIVAGLSVGDPFLQQHEVGIAPETKEDGDEDEEKQEESIEEKERKRKLRTEYFKVQGRFSSLDTNSDALKLLSAIAAYGWSKSHQDFSDKHFLRYKIMEEIHKLRKQIAYIVSVNTRIDSIDATTTILTAKLKPPNATQIKAIKQIITAGFIDQIAVRADVVATDIPLKSKTRIISFPYFTLFPSTLRKSAREEVDPYVYIHPGSVLNMAGSGEVPPEYLVYNTLQLSQNSSSDKVRMKVLTNVTPKQLANVGRDTALITYSKPIGVPKYLDANMTKRECILVPRMGAAIGTGGVGWDLPPCKAIQVKNGLHWVNESLRY
ncbi:uncharacterized protein SAPINGB_P005858 [Magnusiomyces paraingens]|uniref:RNA helicase n=1 Tax=Magnusiomyces paraingens TaxID=2606893 RepID=A0A5E8C473_9ASCO|nr:uncharacterized protein SAPINGB_P005858 [Saprochaete ingens]VVT57765.1 unnamed protein product [Saprochaete ingens]